MNIDLLVENVLDAHVQIQDGPLEFTTIAMLSARARDLTAHNRMSTYLLMNENMHQRLTKLRDMEILLKYPGEAVEDGSKGTLLGMKIYTNERITEGMMFAAMVEEKLFIVAVGMGMY